MPRQPRLDLAHILQPWFSAAMTANRASLLTSSHACNAFGRDDPLVRPHASYLALGATREQ